MRLEVDGLCVVPPEVHGVELSMFDQMIDFLLAKSKELVGCEFSLERGPHMEVTFDTPETRTSLAEDPSKITQFLIQKLCTEERMFRDLAINPVALSLIRHLIGAKVTRFSSHNSFVKWCGDYDSMIVAANMLNGALRIYKTELSDREYRAFCETMLTLVDEVHPVHSGVKH